MKKVPAVRLKPMYGAFKNGDSAHTGVKGTFGGARGGSEYMYVEEMTRDRVVIRHEPKWVGPDPIVKSMPFTSIVSHSRNQDIA